MADDLDDYHCEHGYCQLGDLAKYAQEQNARIEALEREREAHLATLEHMGAAVERMQAAEAALATARADALREAARACEGLPDVCFENVWTEYEHAVNDCQRAILALIDGGRT